MALFQPLRRLKPVGGAYPPYWLIQNTSVFSYICYCDLRVNADKIDRLLLQIKKYIISSTTKFWLVKSINKKKRKMTKNEEKQFLKNR